MMGVWVCTVVRDINVLSSLLVAQKSLSACPHSPTVNRIVHYIICMESDWSIALKRHTGLTYLIPFSAGEVALIPLHIPIVFEDTQ